VLDPKHDMHRHPEDYSLWILGEFDDATGAMLPVEPVLVARASDPAPRAADRELKLSEIQRAS